MSRLDEITSEISRVRDLPYGMAHSSAAEAVLRTVEAEGLDEARAFALFTLVDSYVFGEEGEKAYLPFTKMVRWYDEHPEHFDDYDRHSLFWAFKWMVADLADFPGVPAAQISATLDDMARRYAIAGIGPSAVALVRYKWMRERFGAEATAAYDEWVTAPRDEYSDCEACTPGERASFLFECGRTDEGIRLLERTLADDPHCGTEPADMLSELALAYLGVGRFADAVAAHRRAIQTLADAQSSMAAARGRHVELLGRAGHPERAARRLEGDQRLLTTQESPRTRWAFLRGVLAGLSAAAIVDPEQPVRLGTGPTTIAALVRDVDAAATAIAAALDARNGTDRYARLTAAARAATPVDPPVAIDLAAGPVSPVLPSMTGGPGEAAGLAADPASAVRLVRDSARSLAVSGSFAEAGALYAQLSTGYQDAGLLEDAGHMAANLARCSAALGDPVGASHAFGRATALLMAAGADELDVISVLTARAPIAAQAGDSAAAIADLESVIGAVERRLAGIDPGGADASQPRPDAFDPAAVVAGAALTERTAAELRHGRLIARDTLARLLPEVGRSDAAVAIARDDAEEFLAEGAIGSAAASLLLAAKVHVANARPDLALWFAESAVEGYALSRDRRGRVDAATVLIEVLRATGDEARAAEVAQTLVD